MILQGKNILVISPEPWDHIFVSKHHYAIHLAERGNKVFFLNPPVKSESVIETGYTNVFSVTYRGFPRGLRFYPKNFQKYFIRKKFDELQRLCEKKFDVIWSFDNSVFYDFSVLPADVLKINHIVDLNQDFQTSKAASTADWCFCTSEAIKKRLLNFNIKVFKVNHGYNLHIEANKRIVLPGVSNVKALYAGNLAMPYIDWCILLDVVLQNPVIDFIFIGPDKEILNQNKKQNEAKRRIRTLSNAFFTGRVNSSDLMLYQEQVDIQLVAYQNEYHNEQANPHKIMEYFGSGKMIVATFTAEYKKLSDQNLFLMSKSNDTFSDLFSKAVRELDFWNDPKNQQLRKGFALDNTYDMQIRRIENFINQ